MNALVESVTALAGHRLRVVFTDGVETEADLSADLSGPLAVALADETYFAQVRVARAGRAIEWPNGLDMDRAVLHGDEPAAPPSRLVITRMQAPA